MTRWRALVVVMSVGILTAGHSALRAQRPRPVVPATPAPVPVKPPSVRAWLDADQIPDDGTVKVWIVIDNQSAQPLADVHFEALRLHGFEQVPGCWRDDTPACPPGSSDSDAQDSIARSAQLVRWAEFKRVQKDNGRSSLFGSLRGRNGDTNETFQATVTAPAVQLVSSTRQLSTAWLLAVVGLFGTLITAAVQWFMQRRAERQALFTTLLPKNLKNSESHYLPIQSSANTIVAISETPTVKTDQLTFYCLQLSRRMRQMQQKAGGFYFKSYAGEELASSAWDNYKTQESNQGSASVHPISATLMFKLVGQLEPTSNFSDFREKRTSDPTFASESATLESGLGQWLTTESWTFARECLKVLVPVLGVEINRPHEKWYVDDYAKQKARDNLNDCIASLERLTFGGDQAAIAVRQKLVRTIQTYLDRRWGSGGLAD